MLVIILNYGVKLQRFKCSAWESTEPIKFSIKYLWAINFSWYKNRNQMHFHRITFTELSTVFNQSLLILKSFNSCVRSITLLDEKLLGALAHTSYRWSHVSCGVLILTFENQSFFVFSSDQYQVRIVFPYFSIIISVADTYPELWFNFAAF